MITNIILRIIGRNMQHGKIMSQAQYSDYVFKSKGDAHVKVEQRHIFNGLHHIRYSSRIVLLNLYIYGNLIFIVAFSLLK